MPLALVTGYCCDRKSEKNTIQQSTTLDEGSYAKRPWYPFASFALTKMREDIWIENLLKVSRADEMSDYFFFGRREPSVKTACRLGL